MEQMMHTMLLQQGQEDLFRYLNTNGRSGRSSGKPLSQNNPRLTKRIFSTI